MKNAPISIVVPTYNRLHILKKTLPAVLGQRSVGEVLVVDDGGNDGTWKWLNTVADREPKLRPIRQSPNQGSPTARNRGLREARGSWVLLCDDDVVLEKNYAVTLMEHARLGKFDLISGRRLWLLPDESPEDAEARLVRESRLPVVNTRLLLFNDCADTGTDMEVPLVQAVMLGTQKLFDSVQYDPGYRGNAWREETDLQLSVQRLGFRVGFCPHARCYHIHKSLIGGGGQRARSRFAYEAGILRNNYQFLRKHKSYLVERFPESVDGPLWWLVARAYLQGQVLDKARRVLRKQ